MTAESYCTSMCRDGVWGGGPEILALVNALERTGGRRGIVTICLGGGNAVAMMVERN